MYQFHNKCHSKCLLALAGAFFLLLVSTTHVAFADDDDDMMDGGMLSGWEFEAGAGYVTRNVEEGLLEVADDIFITEVGLSKEFENIGEFGFEIESLFGMNTNWSEVEWVFSFEREVFSDLNAAVSYYVIHGSPEEGTGDEWDLALEYTGFDNLILDAGLLQDLTGGGGIVYWLGVATEYEVLDGVTLTPRIGALYDADYVSEEKDGLNNIEYSLTASWELWHDLEAELNVTYSQMQSNLHHLAREEEDPGEEHDEPRPHDIVWVGFSVEYEF